MSELSQRLADLPPAKRKLLEKLVNASVPATASTGGAAAPPTAKRTVPSGLVTRANEFTTVKPPAAQVAANASKLSLDFHGAPEEAKHGWERFYDAVSRQLDQTVFGELSFFLNYGYVPNLGPQFSRVQLPNHFINKNSVRLALEVIGDCPLKGRRVLDVGCGRGGTMYVINSFFEAAEIVGLDLSPEAIAFCRKVHRYPAARFEQGDAERLPFEDKRFDVVTNIESSHTYPNVKAFYTEAFRVLAPGGHFLYTDVLGAEDWRHNKRLLEAIGVAIERERDITSNVVASCDEVAQSRVQAFHSGNDPQLMQNFLATPDSQVYVEMSARRWKYIILKLRKP